MIKAIKKIGAYASKRKKETRWDVYASHAAFYVILSSLPMAVLVLSIAQKALPDTVFSIAEALSTILPEQLLEAVPEGMVENALSASGPVISVAALLLIWAASKGMKAIAKGLESVYGTSDRRSFIKSTISSLIYTVVLIAIFLVAFFILVYGEKLLSLIFHFEFIEGNVKMYAKYVMRFAWILLFPMFALVFALMYHFLGGKKYPFHKHLAGALFSAGGWLLFSELFALYLRYFPPDKYLVYGSVGTLMLMMLWIRGCMMILLLGAELNVTMLSRPSVVVLSEKKQKKLHKKEKNSSHQEEQDHQ